MALRTPTDQQWAAARATDRHVLVSAGAGTGKTNTVLSRILYLLGMEIRGVSVGDPIGLGDVAAITFTNAAAADLKHRLRQHLREGDRREDSFLVDTARIGTIHSFCGEILREFALRSGRAPAGEVLDEALSDGLTAEVVRDAVLGAIEEDAVSGLSELIAERSVAEIQRYVTQLVGDSDRLQAIDRARETLESRERTIVDLALRTLRLFERRLGERLAVDFDRMIVWTRDLLRDDAAARRALQRRIKVLIVDEFQDVDPVQREIAYLLGDPLGGREDTTRLMFVGDPKQSIYRFRRADVTVWGEVERDFREGDRGLVVSLSENFRSTPAILGWVDATVGALLNQPFAGNGPASYEVRYEPLVPAVGDGAGPPIEIIAIPPRENGRTQTAAAVRRLEARAMAERARALHGTGIEWRDMAVLLHGWHALDVYRDALTGVGAPVRAFRMEGFYRRREVVDMIVALQAVRDPLDDRALLGFLRSPFVGLRDETLLAVARQNRSPYWDGLAEVDAAADSELLRWGHELLGRHVRVRDRMPIDTLLESLLEESGYVAHLLLLGDEHVQAAANVRKFVRLARSAAHAGLGEFLRGLAALRARGDRQGDAPIDGGAGDSVTITSVHSAKGLEWRVVFWCDLVRYFSMGQGTGLLVGRDSIALKDPELSSSEQSAGWKALNATIEREEMAERKRVWYVAATRAKERLVLAGLPLGTRPSNRFQTPADYLMSVLPEADIAAGSNFRYESSRGDVFEAVVEHASTAAPTAAAAASESLEPLESLAGPLPSISVPAGRRRHSASEALAFSRCPRRHWFK